MFSLRFRYWIILFLTAVLLIASLWGFFYLVNNAIIVNERAKQVKFVGERVKFIFDTDGSVLETNQLASKYGMEIVVLPYYDVLSLLDYDNPWISTNPHTPPQQNASIVFDDYHVKMFATCVLNYNNSSSPYCLDIFRATGGSEEYLVYYTIFHYNDWDYFLYASLPLTSSIGLSQIYLKILLLASGASLIFLTIMTVLIARNFSKPICGINRQSKKMAAGDYSVKFEGNGVREIDELCQTFNYTNNELAKTQNLRQDVIANVSHDLKTPLALIKSNAELVMDFPDAPEAKREQCLGLIIHEVDRMTVLVNQMLKLSQAESGNLPLVKTAFNLSELVEKVLSSFEIKSTQGYKLENKVEQNLVVVADKTQIEQVLYNYMNNAITYTGKDLKVRAELKKVKGKARFDVYDTGNGIDEKDKERIWDRYYRVSKQYTRSNGTGLGLSIVKNIMVMHGFNFGVNTLSGKGSDFYFEIPLLLDDTDEN